MPKSIYLVLGAVLVAVIVAILGWWRSGWANTPSVEAALKETLWLSCLLWGILLMISAVGEGFSYTSIHIRGEMLQQTVGGLGLILAMLGVHWGFRFGERKATIGGKRSKKPADLPRPRPMRFGKSFGLHEQILRGGLLRCSMSKLLQKGGHFFSLGGIFDPHVSETQPILSTRD